MTLNELLDMQRELQTHSDTQPQTLEQIHLAQIAELGEVVQAVKWGMEPVSKYPAWAWWHRHNKPVATRAQVADELADLLCFVLLELLHQGIANVAPDPWEGTWKDPVNAAPYLTKFSMYAERFFLATHTEKVTVFVWICRTLGFSQDELEAAYKDAYDKNVARWTA